MEKPAMFNDKDKALMILASESDDEIRDKLEVHLNSIVGTGFADKRLRSVWDTFVRVCAVVDFKHYRIRELSDDMGVSFK